MKYLLVYKSSYSRSEHMLMFQSLEEMNSFIRKDEVYSVISMYKMEKCNE